MDRAQDFSDEFAEKFSESYLKKMESVKVILNYNLDLRIENKKLKRALGLIKK